jgi:hypothetical protein
MHESKKRRINERNLTRYKRHAKKMNEAWGDQIYRIADTVEKQIGNRKSISWDEFEMFLDRALIDVFSLSEREFDELIKGDLPVSIDGQNRYYYDIDSDVRSILSMDGFETIYEGDNEGGLQLVERFGRKEKTEGLRRKRLKESSTPYVKWVQMPDGKWKMWGGSNSSRLEKDFLDRAKKQNKTDYLDAKIAKSGEYPDGVSEKDVANAHRIRKSFSGKPRKSLKESKKLNESFDDMEVFMNTWANYNENGADSGITPTGWMSIDDAIEYCEEYADYEPFINDTDNVPFDDINEYSNASSVLQELKELQESDVDEDVVAAIVEATGYGIKEAVEIAERGDYYWYPGISSYTDLAYAVIDEIGSLKYALGDRVVNYIDEDQMRREYRWDIRETMRDTAEQEVDDEHEGEVDISNVPTSKEFSIDEWFDEDDEYTEDDLREQISDDLEYEYDSAPVSFDIEVSNDGKKVTAKNIEWDGYDREQEIEDWMDEHEDEWLDMIIGEEIEAAERGEADLSSYFDYEAFGRDLSFDGYTITDKGIILVN